MCKHQAGSPMGSGPVASRRDPRARLPAELLRHLVFGLNESQPQNLHLSDREGCLAALRSEVRVLGALCGRTR